MEYYTQFSVLFPVGEGNTTRALEIYKAWKAELEETHEAIGFEAEEEDPATLWLYSEEYGDVEQVVDYALRCAETFDLRGAWGFRWALTASKPNLDAFGGGARMLDLGRREETAWVDCDTWLEEKKAAAEVPRVAAEDVFLPLAAERGWTEQTENAVLLGFLDTLIDDDSGVAERLRKHLSEVAADEEDEEVDTGPSDEDLDEDGELDGEEAEPDDSPSEGERARHAGPDREA